MISRESPNKPITGFNVEDSNKEIDFDLSVGQSVGASVGNTQGGAALRLMNKNLEGDSMGFDEDKDFDVSHSGFDHSVGSQF